MVVGGTTEARRQRILLNRLKAKQNSAELARRQSNEDSTVQNEKEDTPSNYVQSDGIVKPDAKKPKLNEQEEVSSKTVPEGEENKSELVIPNSAVIIANVYRYLEQEYKYMRLINEGQSLRPLAGIQRRTAEATGVTRDVIKDIVNADKEGRLRRRNEESREQRQTRMRATW